MRSGIDRDAMDLTVRPQDDLFGHVNGRWVATTDIPGDRGRYGTFDILREQVQERLRVIAQDANAAVAAGEATLDGAVGKVGALYGSFLDEDRIEALGLEPLAADLAAIDAVSSTPELWRLLGRLAREGVPGAVVPYVNTDHRNFGHYAVYLQQGGIGLPDEAFYRADEYAPLRAAYLAHLTAMARLTDPDEPDPAGDAAAVVDLETRLAAAHWDRVATRDAVKSYTKLSRAALADLAPAVPWDAWFDALGAPPEHVGEVVVRQPSFLAGLSEAVATVPLDQWRRWLRRHVVGAFAGYLPGAFVDETFDFYGRTLSGTPHLRERWKRGIDLLDTLLGEAVGRLYVDAHFPPEAKAKVLTLVDHLVEAYRRDIGALDWMGPATREAALAKLAAFTPKIAYPDTWRDDGPYRVEPTDLVGNVRRGMAFETDRDWAKLGGPVDRAEWFMTPQTVNAYYNPGLNEIVFPAAILQPPFFDVDADDAVNYGAIGSVIGHEIGHGFDDQGSRYDGNGTLAQWWTPEDRERFDELAGRLIAQYDALEPRDLPGERVNGALTVGENIGDLGGVTIAHLAYRISLGAGGLAAAPEIDGMTGAQRFFAGWAQIWRMKARPEEAKRLLAIDPHSPGEFRANIVRNLDEFAEAFGVTDTDGLWLDPADRVRIW